MYRVSESVRSTHGRDGAVVLDIRHGQMFNLNPVGSRILQLLEKQLPESDVVDQISREFEVPRSAAETDVREFLGTLQRHHLLEDPGTNGRH